VAAVRVELPSMERYRGIRFVDTPGLESVFDHNTDASLEWLPNVGLALVAVGVDPPLSRHDIELIRNLSRYTPNISLLLTKVDVLDESERAQVLDFVQKQLARYWNDAVPYTLTRSGPASNASARTRRVPPVSSALRRSRATCRHSAPQDGLPAGECAGYLTVALKAAETADSERENCGGRFSGGRSFSTMRGWPCGSLCATLPGAYARHSRNCCARMRGPARERFLARLDADFPSWAHSLGMATERFDDWLRAG